MASSTSKCRGCLNKANSFCYVCGDAIAQRRTITSHLKTAYFHYFDCKIGDQDKSWAPHICCKPCYNGLIAWFNGKKAAFNFAVPMVWRELRNHADDCYFCLTNITGFNASSRKMIKYPNLRSAMRPVPHSDDLPVPTPPVNKDLLSNLKEGIFVGLQIREVLKDTDFEELLNLNEKHSSQSVVASLVDMTKMESKYQGKWNPGMMRDFYWMLLRDIPEAKYTRSSEKTHFWLSVVLWIV